MDQLPPAKFIQSLYPRDKPKLATHRSPASISLFLARTKQFDELLPKHLLPTGQEIKLCRVIGLLQDFSAFFI
jgi:hypothetical protein